MTTTAKDTALTMVGFMQRMVEGWMQADAEHRKGRESYQHHMLVVFDRALREAALSGDEIDDVAHEIVKWLLDIEDPDGTADVLYDLTEMLFRRLPHAAKQGPEPCTHDVRHPDDDCHACVMEMFATLRTRLLTPDDDD
jgi:hypothetical protein